jgi:RNA polymerase sigma factor (sigma-70 family)
MEDQQQWQSWMRRVAEGDAEAAAEFWKQYGGRLQGLAAEYLTSRLYRREGPEDVVQSVCRSFLMRARAGQFHLEDRDSLWRLLCAITLTKVRQKARYHGRQKRSYDQERPLEAEGADGPPVLSPEPTPAEAAEFADQLERLLSEMDEEERQMVQLRMEQCTHAEIAERLGCSERTVRRLLKRVQNRLKSLFDEPVDELPPGD